MPLLRCDEALTHRPSRVLIAGTSGSGKTTLAERVAEALGVPHVEMDALYHGPNWTPRESFQADVESASSQKAWVMEWQYSHVRPLLADRADLLVWLDLPRRTVMRQVIHRTIRRRLRRQTLWNGNLEPPLWTFLHDAEHIVRWAWRTHGATAVRVQELLVRRPDLHVVRVRSHHEAAHWVAGPLRATTASR